MLREGDPVKYQNDLGNWRLGKVVLSAGNLVHISDNSENVIIVNLSSVKRFYPIDTNQLAKSIEDIPNVLEIFNKALKDVLGDPKGKVEENRVMDKDEIVYITPEPKEVVSIGGIREIPGWAVYKAVYENDESGEYISFNEVGIYATDVCAVLKAISILQANKLQQWADKQEEEALANNVFEYPW